MYLQETHVNADKGWIIYESDYYEVSDNTPGEVFKALLHSGEYGRCVSKVYIDTTEKEGRPFGWTFQKRDKYEGTHEPFLREIWVTCHTAPPTVVKFENRLYFDKT